jgi:PilZ domain
MRLDRLGTSARSLAGSRAYNVCRREPRYICGIPVAMQRFLRFGPAVTRGVTLDVSLQGISALVCGAPRVGETVVIEVMLWGAPIEMLATVRHSSDAKSGFEFFPLTAAAQAGIQNWVTELRRHEETSFPYVQCSGMTFGSD